MMRFGKRQTLLYAGIVSLLFLAFTQFWKSCFIHHWLEIDECGAYTGTKQTPAFCKHPPTHLQLGVQSRNQQKVPRILVTDVMFPNNMAAWRLNEIQALIEHHFFTDILVINRISTFAGVDFSFDYNELKDSHHLSSYELLTFRHSTLHLDAYNERPLEDRHLGEIDADYMLRHRQFHGERVELGDYDLVYHIFYHNYLEFVATFPGKIPFHRHLIHMYPGGGVSVSKPIHAGVLSHDVHLIVAQPFIEDWLELHNQHNPRVHVYGAPLFAKCGRTSQKLKEAKDTLAVSFASLGIVSEKGSDHYVKIAEIFKRTFPKDDVLFFGIGNVPPSPAVIHLDVMSQAQLNAFYRRYIDVAFNLDRTEMRNGWPLGAEAMLQGAILFTTDNHHMNNKTGFHFGDEVYVVVEDDIDATVDKLHELVNDQVMLRRLSRAAQQRSARVFGYENTMKKIIDYMEKIMAH